MPKEVTVKSGRSERKVNAGKIYYIESAGRKVILHLEEEQIEYYDKISRLEQELWPKFIRIHKGYLVNPSYIKGYTRKDVLMENGDSLLISKYRYRDFLNAYEKQQPEAQKCV